VLDGLSERGEVRYLTLRCWRAHGQDGDGISCVRTAFDKQAIIMIIIMMENISAGHKGSLLSFCTSRSHSKQGRDID
jgi:hypothetical protein